MRFFLGFIMFVLLLVGVVSFFVPIIGTPITFLSFGLAFIISFFIPEEQRVIIKDDSSSSNSKQLRELNELLKENVITQEEFDTEKNKILS